MEATSKANFSRLVSSQGVAEAVGRIFDSCFRGDNTVRGQVLAADNPNVLVDIRAVS